jgi:lysophospholipase L1-like esterase
MRARGALTTIGVLVVLLGAPATPSLAESGRSGAHAPLYDVSLGTSLSIGIQPDTGGQNQRTSEGYADQLYGHLQVTTPNLTLLKLGCPDETSVSMIVGGICAYDQGSQLADAVAFLHAHRQFVTLVTLDIGANDIAPCGSLSGLDPACVTRAFATVAANLPRILSTLREAAGPDVPIVAMNYYDPFLAAWFLGSAGQQVTADSAVGLAMFNALLGGIYAAFGVPVADAAGAFHTSDFTPVAEAGGLPLNVVLVCQWTWMCVPPPVGPNIHANAMGYAVIGEAFLAVLP